MFTLHNPMKVMEGNYVVTSHACPMCAETKTIPITGDKLFAYHNGAMAQVVLSEYNEAIRERFISGYCDDCWKDLFGS